MTDTARIAIFVGGAGLIYWFAKRMNVFKASTGNATGTNALIAQQGGTTATGGTMGATGGTVGIN